MIANQVLQNTIEGLKAITRRDFSILNAEAKVIATTLESRLGHYVEEVEAFITSPADSQEMQGEHYFKVYDEYLVEYVVAISSSDDEAYKIGKIAAFQIKSLLVAYKERFDKDNFIKNLLLDNLLLVDIYSRSKKLHIESSVLRGVILIETDTKKDSNISDILRNIFPDKSKDFVTAVDERKIILVKEVNYKDEEELENYAKIIYDTLSSEAMTQLTISVGTVVSDLKDVSNSYKEASMALEVGKIFNSEGYISSYAKLGIGRIIYQLPLSLCKMFIQEVLKGKKVQSFDEETLITVNKFFENSLNVSETSRQLYIHRNTLVYRLDKLLKTTGLDLRKFDDAITFKITIMVSQYMDYIEKQNMARM
ncbi:CdaR family transcriptional regulator [Candidatus Epulonipiscium fishelsonii]|uniref:CdaR family transcriptional regulator n=1 Tax=Candidatus Epulonipiscium fishelsonii TaxID=77094 RepID=A0ACC8XD37_9FIRM|nr:CdaR family transcriptional regulator [Epulopiscium sp. SCG-B11WGA-EpuloA1]